MDYVLWQVEALPALVWIFPIPSIVLFLMGFTLGRAVRMSAFKGEPQDDKES